ncbi:putative pentatricopeptide repeat-containing protein At1g68930 [Oryza glaberrima]|uniref:putative pentatricopeptide repeat-containing protein At1g68930 n=1 Tax=Oryza glaberrima TaxID=4538 RepID=UPI00224BFD16|nr:putative pentatricopeptide repeat-containing protein At1g68930 [Oryza glaberrima]
MAVRDVASLNRMITGFIRDGLADRARAVYRWMVASGIRETPHTFSTILGVCNTYEALQLHGRVLALGLCCNPFVGSALVNHYMHVESPHAALSLFRELPLQNTAMCNVVLRGLGNLKLIEELICCFLDMRRQYLELNGLSYCYAMKGCYQNGEWLEQGRQLHGVVLKAGWIPSNIFLSNSLVDLYSAIGDSVDTVKALNDILSEDVISWNSILSMYADRGHMKEAVYYLKQMLWHGCDQAGMFEEGRLVIELMRASRELDPDERHFACMVNLLSRDGFVKEAMEMMEQSPLRHYTKAWSSLLQSCKAHGENVLGKRAANMLIDVGRKDPATTLQVSIFFNDIGDRETALRIKEMTNVKEVKKSGHSLIESPERTEPWIRNPLLFPTPTSAHHHFHFPFLFPTLLPCISSWWLATPLLSPLLPFVISSLPELSLFSASLQGRAEILSRGRPGQGKGSGGD